MQPGITDAEVLNLANNESAILLTSDKDFGELIFRLHRIAAGVVLIRLFGLASNDVLSGSWSEKNRTQIHR